MPATIARELAPTGSESPLDCRVGAERRVAFARADLGAMKRVEKAFGERTTVNDVALAMVAGALRGWLERRAIDCRRLRVKVPVSMHRAGEHDALGNRDSFMFVDLPVAEPDPVQRLLEVNAETAARKRLGDARTVYDFFNELSHLAPPLYRAASRLAMSPRVFSLSVSNVPGPRQPVSVMGRGVAELYTLAEIAPRHALRVSIVSLAGSVGFGLCADARALPDLPELASDVEHSLEELLAAAP
jgi:WS/DGAT/MGAT family acyltransferase